MEKIRNASLESVVSADGEVCARPPGQENRVRQYLQNAPDKNRMCARITKWLLLMQKQATGEIEVVLEEFQVLSTSMSNLPFSIPSSPKVIYLRESADCN